MPEPTAESPSRHDPERSFVAADPVLRRTAVVGWVLTFAWTVTLVVWGIVAPDPYAHGWRLVLELAFMGRVVSIADGVANGFSTAYLLVQTGVQDILLLLVLYPPVVAACEGIAGRGFFGRWLEGLRATAETHKSRVEPLGAIGLWVFVFFPFWSTGALVGGVVGYLLGMRMRVVFASVFTGHVLSVLVLLFAFDAVRDAVEVFDSSLVKFLPWIVLALMVAIALVMRWWKSRRAG